MKSFAEILLFVILYPFIQMIRITGSLLVRFFYRKRQVFLYNGPWGFTLYRVTHVPIIGKPSFNVIHLGEDEVNDDIRYGWNCKFLNHYQIRRFLQRIPYDEYEPIEKKIQKTEQHINNLLKKAAANSNHPSEFLPGMNLWDEKGSVFQLNEPQEESDSWLADCISINESLPLIEQKGGYIFENEDKSDYVVITKAVFEQIRTIGKDRHIIIQKELLAIKDRYMETDRQTNLDPIIIFPWGIYG